MLHRLLLLPILFSIITATLTSSSAVYAFEYSCSVAPVSESATDKSVRVRVTYSTVNAVGDSRIYLAHDGESRIEGVRDPESQVKDEETGAISFEYEFTGLEHPASEYRVEADNNSASSGYTRVPCEGATSTDTGQEDVDPDGNVTDGPAARIKCYDHTNPIIYNSSDCVEKRATYKALDLAACNNHTNPIVYTSEACAVIRLEDAAQNPIPSAPTQPKPGPCEDKTGSDKANCEAKIACDKQKENGRVFIRAFNNACVTLPEFTQTLVNYAMMFAAVIAGFMFLQGGIKVIASRGNPAAMVEARSTLINAAVGLVLLATAYVIIKFLSDAFGYGVTTDINLLGPFVP